MNPELLNHVNHNYAEDPDFWGHKYGFLNFAFVDGHVEFMSMQETYLGLRNIWSSSNARDTMWDARR